MNWQDTYCFYSIQSSLPMDEEGGKVAAGPLWNIGIRKILYAKLNLNIWVS